MAEREGFEHEYRIDNKQLVDSATCPTRRMRQMRGSIVHLSYTGTADQDSDNPIVPGQGRWPL